MSWKGSGSANYLDLTYGPVGLWNLNENLTDRTGNGATMTLETGTARYAELLPGMRGFFGDGVSWLINNASPSQLQIRGDCTIEVLCNKFEAATRETLVSFGDPLDAEADNYLYLLGTNGAISIRAFHEDGAAGNNDDYTINDGYPLYAPMHIAEVRSGNAYTFYLNGRQIGATSTTFAAPTGGTASRLRIAGSDVAGEGWSGVVASVKVLDKALSPSQILEEFSRTLGPVYGMR